MVGILIDKFPRNNTFKDLTIYFFIVGHEDVIQHKENGRTYLWYDKAACELDNIFCEKNQVYIRVGTNACME